MTVALDACPRCGYVLEQPPPPPVRSPGSRRTSRPVPALPGARAAPRRAARRTGLSTASVPKILLGLGATCLLVAAVIFLAVAWSWLGVGGRTAVLVLLTAATAAGGQLLARRDLGLAAEALTTVSLGLLVLDTVGADRAGWLGDLDNGALVSVVGGAVLLASLALSLLAPGHPAGRRPARGRRHRARLHRSSGPPSARSSGAPRSSRSPGRAGCRCCRGRRWPSGCSRTACWGWARWTRPSTSRPSAPSGSRATASGWSPRPRWRCSRGSWCVATTSVRQLSCAFAASVLTFTAAVPVLDESLTALALAACAGAAGWTVVAAIAPPRWYAVPRVPLLGSLVVLVPLVGLLVAQAAANLVTVAAPFTASAAVRLSPADPELHPLLLPLGVLVAVAAYVLTVPRRWPLRWTVAPVVALAAVLTAALYPLPLWLFVLALGPFGVVVAWPSALLTLLVLTETVAIAAALLVRRRLEQVAGAVLPVAIAGALWAGGHLLDVGPDVRSLVTLGVLGLVAIALPRVEVEAPVAVGALYVATLGVPAAADPSVSLAVHLTLAGALVTAMALVHRDHRSYAWLGGLLLVLATWVRLSDIGVQAPEPYTLPTALALLAVGLHRMRRDPASSTSNALLPGLVLGVVPTLLWALVFPLSVRAAVIGLVFLVLLVGGSQLRWSAPVLVGGVGGALLVLRELAPYAEQTPQWLLIGAAGTILIGTGVTWEARVRDLRRATGYLGRLR